MTWRTGTKNPHALYERDEPVGMVIAPRDGERIVAAMNAHDGALRTSESALASANHLLRRVREVQFRLPDGLRLAIVDYLNGQDT